MSDIHKKGDKFLPYNAIASLNGDKEFYCCFEADELMAYKRITKFDDVLTKEDAIALDDGSCGSIEHRDTYSISLEKLFERGFKITLRPILVTISV